jgi:hypothetical protein
MIPIDRDLDEEITAIEVRIHQRTVRVLAKGRRVGTALQRSLTSPAALLLAVGTGFAIGRITEGPGASGQTRLARAWFSISQGVKAALTVVRAPAFVWLARLFGTTPSPAQSGSTPALRAGANSSPDASFPSTPQG